MFLDHLREIGLQRFSELVLHLLEQFVDLHDDVILAFARGHQFFAQLNQVLELTRGVQAGGDPRHGGALGTRLDGGDVGVGHAHQLLLEFVEHLELGLVADAVETVLVDQPGNLTASGRGLRGQALLAAFLLAHGPAGGLGRGLIRRLGSDGAGKQDKQGAGDAAHDGTLGNG